MAEEQGSAFRLRAEFADRSWEALLSNLLCPPVLWAALALPVSYRDAVAGQQPLLWAAAYICFVCLLPTLYVGVNVLRGSITDLHLRERRQRHRPYIVSILCALFAWLALGLLGGTEIIRALALFSAANMAAMAAITVFWQISMHTMSASSALVALAIFFSPLVALPFAPLPALIYAARHRLGRHSHAELLGGALLGALLSLLWIALHPGV